MLFNSLRNVALILALAPSFAAQSAQGQEAASSGHCLDLLPYAGYTISDELIVTTTGEAAVATVTGDYFVSRAAFDAETMRELRKLEETRTRSYLAYKEGEYRLYLVAETAESGCVRYPLP
ncbi:hypothetical protein K2P47_03955 [Patescibacteria group bacterium]|nr:hypothetical protein [Patescibacteria group bacterium]